MNTKGITEKGYRRVWNHGTKKLQMEHVIVWEQHHKRKLPDGMQIHHRDGNKLNNDIENLEAVTALQHKRIHGNCIQKSDGTWFKPCGKCKKIKPESEYYKQKGWLMSECKQCHVRRSVTDKRNRKNI